MVARKGFYFIVGQRSYREGTFNVETATARWRNGAVFVLMPVPNTSRFEIYVTTRREIVGAVRNGVTTFFSKARHWAEGGNLPNSWEIYATVDKNYFFTEIGEKRCCFEVCRGGTLNFLTPAGNLQRLGPVQVCGLVASLGEIPQDLAMHLTHEINSLPRAKNRKKIEKIYT